MHLNGENFLKKSFKVKILQEIGSRTNINDSGKKWTQWLICHYHGAIYMIVI